MNNVLLTLVKGLFALSSDPNVTVLASLGKDVGYVSIHSYGEYF